MKNNIDTLITLLDDMGDLDFVTGTEVVQVLAERGVIAASDLERLRRQAYIAYLHLNIRDCSRCHLPNAEDYICPCGYDGSE